MTNAELADEIEHRVQREVEGELSVRIRVLTELPQIIAVLRQPSSDKVLVKVAIELLEYAEDVPQRRSQASALSPYFEEQLSAAEAEGPRKPCPLCGSTEPHAHTSGPMEMS